MYFFNISDICAAQIKLSESTESYYIIMSFNTQYLDDVMLLNDLKSNESHWYNCGAFRRNG